MQYKAKAKAQNKAKAETKYQIADLFHFTANSPI
jgi:hypothetical protein